ncbi:hypothetical protein KC355_g7527 [Hortaea werneckii]|nr:hypothetical protein KC355_g7527 [Hortaea werneckii]
MSWNLLPQWLLPGAWREENSSKPGSNASDKTTGESSHGKVDIKLPEPDEDAESDGEGTPKAKPANGANSVPTLMLDGNDNNDSKSKEQHTPASTFPAANNAQKTSDMPPPPKPTSASGLPSTKPAAGLMPPPSRPAVSQRGPPPSAASSLRVPSTGPLPNRGPPANSQQRASGGLSPNGTAVSTPNPRGKVLLSPGHSPMDWAALTRSGNLAGVNTFQRVTPSQLKAMTGRKGKPAWSSWQGKVYNITPYLPFHPGGEPELMKAAGRDDTKLFMDVHPWVNWENMLSSCLVGVMVPEDYGKQEGSSLEDMD